MMKMDRKRQIYVSSAQFKEIKIRMAQQGVIRYQDYVERLLQREKGSFAYRDIAGEGKRNGD